MKIAVIGSGIAGLSAAWFLGRSHEVTIYERGPGLGMDAHSVEVSAGDQRVSINVPMRVFFVEYYPTLAEIYRSLGIEFAPVQYSASFSELTGDTYFRFRNFWFGSRSISYPAGRSAVSPAALKMGAEILRFVRRRENAAQRSALDAVTLETYLKQNGYSQRFANKFLYPAFAGICTCNYDEIRAYPASIILDYLQSGLMGSRVNRLVNGTQDAATRLASWAKERRFNSALQAILPGPEGVELREEDGHCQSYDHVVVATQANQALSLLPQEMHSERAALARFDYVPSRVVVHREESLAPRDRSEWAPVNFALSDTHDKPMASIWMNRIHPELEGQPNVFETWNPLKEIPQEKLLLEAEFERPVVNTRSLAGIDAIAQMHQEPDRRVWFCGSYAKRGIPLLESAAASAKAVADYLIASEKQKKPGTPNADKNFDPIVEAGLS